jgi:AcrR family transcriptional regulator
MVIAERETPMNNTMKTDSAIGRAQLIEATLDCIALDGLADTTVRSIAEKAGVSAGLVRHHFQSKDRLLVEAYRHMNETWLARVRTAFQPKNEDISHMLERALKAYFPNNPQDIQRMRIIVAYWGLVVSDNKVSEIQIQTYSSFQVIFKQLLTPYVSSLADVETVAIGMIGLADGLWLECCLNPNRLTHEEAIEITKEFVLARLRK